MKPYDNYLRWLYRGGRPSRFARLQNRAAAAVFAAGIFPARTQRLPDQVTRGRGRARDHLARPASLCRADSCGLVPIAIRT